jgi:ABC-type bacteriocin/lantibiotic exporter with double-glycine peptidase domain
MQRSRLCILMVLMLSGVGSAAGLANLWIDVPYVPQQKQGCGAASMAMVMQYWERQQGQPSRATADSAQILRALRSNAAHGIYASDMVRYFQQHGYRTFAFSGAWSDLESELGKGRPLIVALHAGSGRELHYVVVAGIDDEHQLVLVNDPAQRKLLKEDQARFEREWKASGYWTLLAVPQTSSSGSPGSH